MLAWHSSKITCVSMGVVQCSGCFWCASDREVACTSLIHRSRAKNSKMGDPSKGFSHHSCHAFQGKCNKGRSTRRGHFLSATRYIPHDHVSSHSPIGLHSLCTCYNLQPLLWCTPRILELFLDSVKSRAFHLLSQRLGA